MRSARWPPSLARRPTRRCPPPKKVKPAAKKDKEEPKAKAKAKAKKEEDQEADAPPEEENNAAAPVANPTLAQVYASLLAKELFEAFRGTDGARESGLLNVPTSQLGAAAGVARQIADLQDAVAKAAVELVKAPPGEIEKRKKDLGDRVAGLEGVPGEEPAQGLPSRPRRPRVPPCGCRRGSGQRASQRPRSQRATAASGDR